MYVGKLSSAIENDYCTLENCKAEECCDTRQHCFAKRPFITNLLGSSTSFECNPYSYVPQLPEKILTPYCKFDENDSECTTGECCRAKGHCAGKYLTNPVEGSNQFHCPSESHLTRAPSDIENDYCAGPDCTILECCTPKGHCSTQIRTDLAPDDTSGFSPVDGSDMFTCPDETYVGKPWYLITKSYCDFEFCSIEECCIPKGFCSAKGLSTPTANAREYACPALSHVNKHRNQIPQDYCDTPDCRVEECCHPRGRCGAVFPTLR